MTWKGLIRRKTKQPPNQRLKKKIVSQCFIQFAFSLSVSLSLYIYIYIYISSLSCGAISTDVLDHLSLPNSIVHRSRQVHQATCCIGTELLYIGSSWLSYLFFFCPCKGVHWSTSLMSSSACLIWEFSWWVVGDHSAAVLWDTASRNGSIQLAAFLCNCRQTLSPHI